MVLPCCGLLFPTGRVFGPAGTSGPQAQSQASEQRASAVQAQASPHWQEEEQRQDSAACRSSLARTTASTQPHWHPDWFDMGISSSR